MYMNTGYLKHSHMDFKDKSRPLIVGSCGIYRLSEHPKMPTYPQEDVLIFRLYILQPDADIFILILLITKQLFPLVTLSYSVQKSFRNMNTMGKIRQKSTGFILLEVM